MQSKTICTTAIAFAGIAVFGVAEANAADVFTWKPEAPSALWHSAANWTVVRDGDDLGDSNYPGHLKAGDQAVIVDVSGGTYENDPVMSTALPYSIDTLTVNANGFLTVSGTMTVTGVVTVNANGGLTVSGTMTVTGDVTVKAGGDLPVSGTLKVDDLTICNGAPAGGLVRIEGGTICLEGVLTIKYDSVEVENGELRVGSSSGGGTFKMESAQTHRIGGYFKLMNSASILRIAADVTLDPWNDGTTNRYGVLSGEDNAAQFKIDEPSSGDNQVLNNITVAGNMWIKIGKDAAGTATFKNGASGIVQADVAGILKFGTNVLLCDASGALWKALSNSGAVLQFHKAATGLVGGFVLEDCATLRFHANITTTGSLAAGPDGFVDVVSATFCYNTATCWSVDHTFGSCS